MPPNDTELGRIVHVLEFDDRDLERSFAKAGKGAGEAAASGARTGGGGVGAVGAGALGGAVGRRPGRLVVPAAIAIGPRGERTAFLVPPGGGGGGRGPVGTATDAAIAGRILSEGRGAGVVGRFEARIAGAAASLGPFGVAVAAAVVGLGAQVLVIRKVSRALNRMGDAFSAETRRLAGIDPLLAGTAARGRISGLRRDIERGQAIGGQLSGIERIRQRRLDIQAQTRNAIDRGILLPLARLNEFRRLGVASLLSPTGPLVRGLAGGQGLGGLIGELIGEVQRGIEAIKNPRKSGDDLTDLTNAQFRRDMESIAGVPSGFLGRADEDPSRSIQFRPPDTAP